MGPIDGAIEIRSARVGDLADLAAIDAEAFGPADDQDVYGVPTLRQLLDLFADLLIVGCCDGRIVAYAAAGISSQRDRGWILSVAVGHRHRGVGAGAALTQNLLDRLRRSGVSRVLASVHPDNIASQRMLTARGFVEASRDDAYFGPGHPGVIMGRSIG